MSQTPATGHVPAPAARLGRLLRQPALVVAGIVLGQAVLFGPSLTGSKILLPLDCLDMDRVYLPASPETAKAVPHDYIQSDLVLSYEPDRQFAASEVRAGRRPMWNPYQYAGSAFHRYPLFSPFGLLCCLIPSPVVLAWHHLLLCVLFGLGIYLFCRRVLQTGPWPATLAAWCGPLTSYFVFWQGFNPPSAIVWLPWLLLCIDHAVRQANRWAGLALALVTGLLLLSAQLDMAGLVLLTAGLFAVWCILDVHGKRCFARPALKAAAVLVAGWALGFLLAAAQFLPVLEYAQTGERMLRRIQGYEERPPVGWEALPQTVLPDMYGSTRKGSFPSFPKNQTNQLEGSAAFYTGLLATLFLAPLAWCSRRRRSVNLFLVLLTIIGLGWSLDVPGVVQVLRLPLLNMASYNRLVFAGSFAVLALMAVGLDVLFAGDVRRRWWFAYPAALLGVLLLFCVYRMWVLPEPVATQLAEAIRQGKPPPRIFGLAAVAEVQASYVRSFAVGAVLCVLALAGWWLLWSPGRWRAWLLPPLAALLLLDLLWFAYGRSAQCDPALYYPPVPALEALAKAPPGRIIGSCCLPPQLPLVLRLPDVRGYDAVDPARLLDLMKIAADPKSPKVPYALTQWMIPKMDPATGRLSPVLDMLNVRYVVLRGDPPPGYQPEFRSPDYWVYANPAVLPRAFVPEEVVTLASDEARLARLAAPSFDPRQVAYVEVPVELPGQCRGAAAIVEETPTRVTLALEMETPGLVVLADLWDKGWKASLDGAPVPILRTNHAIRGVVVPAGKATLEFRYEPASVTWGLRLGGLALLILAGWAAVLVWRRKPGAAPGALGAARVPPREEGSPAAGRDSGRHVSEGGQKGKRRRGRRP